MKDNLMEAIERMAKVSGIDLRSLNINMCDMKHEEKKNEFNEIEPFVLKQVGYEFKNVKSYEEYGLSENLKKEIKEFMNNPEKKFLIFRGGTGTAKTCIAKILLQRYFEKLLNNLNVDYFCQIKDEAYYTRAIDFFEKIKECMKRKESTEAIFQNLLNYRFLIFDEVGASYGSIFEINSFTRLIDDFYRLAGLKMLLITNLKEDDELKNYIGYRSFSRICQYGAIVNFNGEDYRIKDKKEVVA